MLTVEKLLEAHKRTGFFAKQLIEMLEANARIHELFLRSSQISVHVHQPIGDAFRRDFIASFFDR